MGQNAIYLKKGGLIAAPASDEVAIIAESDGTIETLSPAGVRAVVGPGSTVLSRARALLPTAGLDTVLGTDFDNDRWFTTTATNGTATPSQTDRGGVLDLTSTATANSVVKVQPSGKPSHVDNTRTRPFYATWRMKFGTVIDAQGYVACMLLNPAGTGNPGIFFGALGNRSTANWSYEVIDNAGGVVGGGASSVALDTTNYHTVEIVNDATNYTFYLDGVLLFTQAVAAAGTNPTSLQFYCGNGTTATARTAKLESMWFVVAGN